MSGTTSSTACYVDALGIHSPPFTTILSFLQGQVQGIFGADTVLSNDSADGQILGIFAQAVYDSNSMAVAVYNSYSPATAVGVGLSSVVKINGIARELPTNSSGPALIIGVAGTTITGGIITDPNNNQWALASPTIIPFTGSVTVTATAVLPGALTLPAGSVVRIATPTYGWQSVSIPQDATPGAPLETDPALRLRQTTSTMLPSQGLLDGQTGNLLALAGVTRVQTYENNTDLVDVNGQPPHSVSFVVEGGNLQSIANTIALGKTPGADTYGTTSEIVIDAYGIPHTINFFVPTEVTITATLHLTALAGYSSSIGVLVVNAVVNYISELPIGADVFVTQVIAAAIGGIPVADSLTFNLTSLQMAAGANPLVSADIPILFNQAATASSSTITVLIP